MPLFPVRRDAETAEFFDGTARGELLLVREKATGRMLDPKFDVGDEPEAYERVPAAGTGAVMSWSVVHGRGPDGATTRTVVGIVELDEGPWWWTEIAGADPDADLMGARVRATFVPTGPAERDEAIPVFELA